MFFTTWTHHSSIQVPKNIWQQVFAYMRSPEFTSTITLVTTTQVKHVAHSMDIEIFLKCMWGDESHFCNTRECITCTTLTAIQLLTNDQLGTFTVSSNWPDCKDSILHHHLDVHVQPNPDNPRSPFIYIIIKINDIKNVYKDDFVFKYVVFYLEPDESWSMCVITGLISLLLQDDVFVHLHSPEEIFHPINPPMHAYSLPIKSEWQSVLVFQWIVFDLALQLWITHPSDVVSYLMYYRWLQYYSLSSGFHCMSFSLLLSYYYFSIPSYTDPLTPYYICRPINSICAAISVEDWDKILTHTGPLGQMFVHSLSRFPLRYRLNPFLN